MSDSVPIITANFEPFRFAVRDDNDRWTPTLDEVNGRSYDYVKLHRMTTNFDVGIAPFSMANREEALLPHVYTKAMERAR